MEFPESLSTHFAFTPANHAESNKMDSLAGSQYANPDVAQRQALIDQLIIELDKKTQAIEKIGFECVSLRKKLSARDAEIAKLQKKVEECDLASKRLMKAFDVDIIPPDELRRRYALISGKLETALERLEKQEESLVEFTKIKKQHHKLSKEFKALQDAHTAQQNLVLNLQENVQKSERLKAIVLQQEKVISGLEAKTKHISIPSTNIVPDKHPELIKMLMDENTALKQRLTSLEAEQSQEVLFI
jgi:hypothetical protein